MSVSTSARSLGAAAPILGAGRPQSQQHNIAARLVQQRWHLGSPLLAPAAAARQLAARPSLRPCAAWFGSKHGSKGSSSDSPKLPGGVVARLGGVGKALPDRTSGSSLDDAGSDPVAAAAAALDEAAAAGDGAEEAGAAPAPAEALSEAAPQLGDGTDGSFNASQLFQGMPLDWQAVRSLQAPKAPAAAEHQQQQVAAEAATATLEEPAATGQRYSAAHIGTLWGLLVLSVAYLHHSTSGFALPALLPIISEDLKLSDNQGALLTAGYTVLYALTLVPVGLLADRVDRPKLLAGGITLWSLLTMAASETRSFGQLLAMRVGFAAAQATQNPICFSLIPELFPKNRTTAMAVYNTAIYAGRALSFAALILAGQLGVPQVGPSGFGELGISTYTLVPLDKVDLSLVSVLYTQGDYAAVTPVYTYAMEDDVGVPIESAFSAWRPLLRWLGPPGMLIAALVFLTVEEPRQRGKSGRFLPLMTLSKESIDEADLATPISQLGQPAEAQAGGKAQAGGSSSSSQAGNGNAQGDVSVQQILGGESAAAAAAVLAGGGDAATAAALLPGTLVSVSEQAAPASIGESLGKLRGLVASPAFLALTLAAALNDVGSWALVSWQATFYQRVYELEPATYAPLLAVVIPVGGIIGGVGAGVFGDWLSRLGARGWLTAGSCIAAAPLIALSLLAPDYKQSFAALLVGFALSECWRAPAAVMVREVSPTGLGSTASAMHLCIRNLVGGLGPIGVALLSSKVGLQMAMLLVPSCYLLSGLGLAVTEQVISSEKKKKHAEHLAAAALAASPAADP